MLARLTDAIEGQERRGEQVCAIISRWNLELAVGQVPQWPPSIRTPPIAGMYRLEVRCPAVTIGTVDLTRSHQHPEGAVAAFAVGLTCSRPVGSPRAAWTAPKPDDRGTVSVHASTVITVAICDRDILEAHRRVVRAGAARRAGN